MINLVSDDPNLYLDSKRCRDCARLIVAVGELYWVFFDEAKFTSYVCAECYQGSYSK